MQTAGDAIETTIPGQPDAHPARSGTQVVLGRYRLVRRLGAGAFGVVWLAHDERLDRVVAVKRIELHDDQIAARAEREALAAARLSHPAIVALFEAGRDDAAVFLVSELVRGRTLAELTEAGELSDRDVLRIGAALCDGLEHAHLRGVVHRDVKPANVIVPDRPAGEAGLAKLTDFGVAHIAGDAVLTRTGDVVGTLAYMAPEQADGHEPTGQADLYALGLVLYEALSGVNPIRGPGAGATARRVGTTLPPLSRMCRDLPRPVCAAIDRAVRSRPGDRGTLGDLRDALDGALDESPDDALGDAGPDPAPRTAAAPRTSSAPVAWPQDSPPAAGPHDAAALAGGESERERPSTGTLPLAGRSLAAAGAAALVACVLSLLPAGHAPAPGAALAGAAGTALAVLLLPRLGWVLALAGICAWLVATGLAGLAVLLVLGALPTMVLLARSGELWSAPPAAILLGLGGLALTWPALAGQVRGGVRRAVLGALGLWWLVLAEAVAAPRLLAGDAPGTAARATWEDSPASALTGVAGPVLGHGILLLAVVWAAAAWVLPLLVRGRSLPVDVVAVSAWAGGLAAATASLTAALPWDGTVPPVRGLVAGAVVAGVVALAAAAARGGT